MLDLGNGSSFCGERPGFYLREIAGFRRLKEAYTRAGWRPWQDVGPLHERDELGGRWRWNWFVE
jgi:hypothetical protein